MCCPELCREIALALSDAGCTKLEIQRFLECWRAGNTKCQREFLQRHRKLLLEALRTDKMRIDCLDYLADQLEQPAFRTGRPDAERSIPHE